MPYKHQYNVINVYTAMNDKKITGIRYVGSVVPVGSSGTGYDMPDVYEIAFDDHSSKECWISTWCRPRDMWKQEYDKGIHELCSTYNIEIANAVDFFDKFVYECMFHEFATYKGGERVNGKKGTNLTELHAGIETRTYSEQQNNNGQSALF